MAIVVALLIATCCITMRSQLVSLFISSNASPNVRQLAEDLMIVVGIFQPFQMIAVIISGALRGAGDVRYTARVMTLTVAVMRPVLALLAVYIFKNKLHMNNLALIGAWCASLADMLVRMSLMLKRYHEGKWHDIRV